MNEWSMFFSQVCLVLVSSICILLSNKKLRATRGALTSSINLDDLLVLTTTCLLWVICVTMLPGWVAGVYSLVLFGYGLLVWLDALLFIQYRIEINRQSIAWFFTGHRGLSKGVPHLLAGATKSPLGPLVPFLWAGLIAITFMVQNSVALLYCYVLVVGCAVYFSVGLRLLAGVSIFPAAYLYFHPELMRHLEIITAVLGVSAVLCVLGLALARALLPTAHAFFTSPTLLTKMFSDDGFDADENTVLLDEHAPHVRPKSEVPARSEFFASCRGANVILITVESMGAYIEPYVSGAAKSLVAKKLQQKSWISKQHFCLCPNTTVSTNQMYSGAYSNNPYNKTNSLFPGQEPTHVAHLRKAGYKTMFLDSADIGLYDYHRLLTRIGFDKVWGTNDIPSNNLKADYRLLNMVDAVVEEAGDQPFFLHIINDQTHMPYEVVDTQRFNRHPGKDARSKYLNALEEVDFIVDKFLDELGQKLDLSNTLIVFTGDHGESFGEFGYSFHSNSVIPAQMQVPFMMSHPNLAHREIEHSCHFDLFPTFFDLLGIECDYATIGQSLGLEEREFAYFFHSATLKGNSPANFGFMLGGQMFWMDRLFNQVNVLQNSNQKIKIKDKDYVKTLLFKMLREREILG